MMYNAMNAVDNSTATNIAYKLLKRAVILIKVLGSYLHSSFARNDNKYYCLSPKVRQESDPTKSDLSKVWLESELSEEHT